jgi:hypothetical protein
LGADAIDRNPRTSFRPQALYQISTADASRLP